MRTFGAVSSVKQIHLTMPLLCAELITLLSNLVTVEQSILEFDEDQDPFPLLDALQWPKKTATALDTPYTAAEESTVVHQLFPMVTSIELTVYEFATYGIVACGISHSIKSQSPCRRCKRWTALLFELRAH